MIVISSTLNACLVLLWDVWELTCDSHALLLPKFSPNMTYRSPRETHLQTEGEGGCKGAGKS